jgi:hypothetical protein
MDDAKGDVSTAGGDYGQDKHTYGDEVGTNRL